MPQERQGALTSPDSRSLFPTQPRGAARCLHACREADSNPGRRSKASQDSAKFTGSIVAISSLSGTHAAAPLSLCILFGMGATVRVEASHHEEEGRGRERRVERRRDYRGRVWFAYSGAPECGNRLRPLPAQVVARHPLSWATSRELRTTVRRVLSWPSPN